ncbi:MAG: A/G-specific adenine glycosylase [Promethearchaeota archaeon]
MNTRKGKTPGSPAAPPERASFQGSLLDWFAENRRDFFWRRERPGVFSILVSEVLLQRTPAGRVDEVVGGLLTQYPNARELGKAPLGDLETFLQPLGLHRRRARALHELALDICEKHGGRVPRAYEKLLSLRGVGEYIARAVRCFGFGYREAIVDVNVVRVFSRAFSVEVKEPASDPRRNPHVARFARDLLPAGREKVKEYNWALLDLGALVCKARQPSCGECPVREWCDFFKVRR